MQLSSLLLTAVVSLAGFQGAPPDGGIPISQCVVTLKDEVRLPADLPSQEAGVLTTLRTKVRWADGTTSLEPVSAGMEVKKGQVLGQIDNQMAEKMKEVAEHKLAIAEEEAGNEVSVKYAKVAHKVALADLKSAKEANLVVPGTIPNSELRRLALLCDQFDLQTEQAIYELGIAAISVQAQQAQLDAAKHDVGRRDIISRIDGVIVEVYPHEGEWLRPGDPIVHIVRMDQLWVEGRLDSTQYSPADVAGRPVIVGAVLSRRGQYEFEGRIDFVSPIVDADNRFKVRAIVVNKSDQQSGQWLLRPGMETTMTIDQR
jgi:multidrug efflux pump subunit AcrA (membrane-fusion protein)